MATKKVSSKDPRVQAALDARRARVAEKIKAKQKENKPKAKAMTPGQERTKGIMNIIRKRSTQAGRVADKTAKGK